MPLIVAVRADASIELGSGHVRRCLSLAQRVRELGADVTFLSRTGPGDCFPEIAAAGFTVTPLPQANAEHEALLALRAIESLGAVVVDHYELAAEWESAVREICPSILAIDDLADREHCCDLLLDQNITALVPGRYAKLVPQECDMLLGPRYALLRPEFDRAKRRVREGAVRNVVVSFGGFDATNATATAIRALLNSSLRDAAIDVVLDARAPHAAEVRDLCAQGSNLRFLGAVSEMAARLEDADLALGACGTSQWERAYLGVPSLLVSVAPNQIPAAELCHARGIAEHAGRLEDLTVASFSQLITDLAEDPQRRRRYSASSLELMGEGGGAAAVAQALLKHAVERGKR